MCGKGTRMLTSSEMNMYKVFFGLLQGKMADYSPKRAARMVEDLEAIERMKPIMEMERKMTDEEYRVYHNERTRELFPDLF